MLTITSSPCEREARRVRNAVPSATHRGHGRRRPSDTPVLNLRHSSQSAFSGLLLSQEIFSPEPCRRGFRRGWFHTGPFPLGRATKCKKQTR